MDKLKAAIDFFDGNMVENDHLIRPLWKAARAWDTLISELGCCAYPEFVESCIENESSLIFLAASLKSALQQYQEGESGNNKPDL